MAAASFPKIKGLKSKVSLDHDIMREIPGYHFGVIIVIILAYLWLIKSNTPVLATTTTKRPLTKVILTPNQASSPALETL